MLYTQTSLSLVYNLERVSKSLHCYCATYQFGIVAWLRLEPNSYSTKLYSLHRRCSLDRLQWLSGSSLSRSCCLRFTAPWSWWPPNVAVAACWTCSFGWRYGNDAITPYSFDHGAVLLALCSELCSVRWARWWWCGCAMMSRPKSEQRYYIARG